LGGVAASFTNQEENDNLAPVNVFHFNMPNMKLFTPREAAKVLGISYPTLKQWIYKEKIRTVKTAGGHHRVPETEVDKFLYRASERGEVSERRPNFRRISGRNQLIGRVTEIKISGLMAQVMLSIGGQHITSIITADAVREMRLKVGDTAAALVKSTEVMIVRS
jgi:molybdopterin-binding protein